MAAAHVCMTCGLDLARVRAQRDPHYQLPLVICPRCQKAAVRRRHPIIRRFRTARRLATAFAVIAGQLAFITLFAIFNAVAVAAMISILLDVPRFRSSEEIRIVTALSMFVLPVILGTWLTIAFGHLKRWRVWLGWFAFMLVPVALFGFALAAGEEFAIAEYAFGEVGWRYAASLALSTGLFAFVGAGPLAGMMMVAAAGILVGRALLWVHEGVRASMWKFRLRTARRGRIS